jgi:purine-binding chemotaxis protein CheW
MRAERHDEGGDPPGPTCALLTFRLDEERFAVRARLVHEVVRAVAVARLPDAPSIIEGAVNYRGRVVPVVRVRGRLGLDALELHPSHHFIVADVAWRQVALWVDEALDLISVDENAIGSAARTAPGATYTEGIARLPEGLVVIHDLERFLSLEEGEALDAAMDAGHSAPDGSDP